MVDRATGQVYFKYLLADSWFSGAENLNWIVNDCKRDFIIKVRNVQNHFAMKTQIMDAVTKAAYNEYIKLSTPKLGFNTIWCLT